MAEQPRNFLLGFGERLTAPVQLEKGMEASAPPYSFQEAMERLIPMVASAAADLRALLSAACPDDYGVALLTLHPEYIAKSYYPEKLLRAVRMEAVGSRPARVTPDKWKKKREPEEVSTTELGSIPKKMV